VPRRPRLLQHGIYHLTSHGSDERYLFLDDHDRYEFLGLLARICERFELALLSYVLMGNHYHGLLRIPDARLSRALQRLHTEYSRRHNRRRGRSTHLFKAHAFTSEIESDRQLVAACRYLARNPVRAGLVADPLDWPWGSARAHAGLEAPSILLAEDDLSSAFGGGPNWRRRYREQVRAQAEPDDLTAYPPPRKAKRLFAPPASKL
jgi:putative transposase